MYLRQCLTYLQDFLEQCGIPQTDCATTLSHHVDGHDDLIFERQPVGDDTSSINDDHFDIATAAEHLRYAASCLTKITGRGEGGDVEDVLGVVFEK